MPLPWILAALSLLVFVAILGYTVLLQRRLRRQSEELGAAYDSVEQLQNSFNRFVPWQLVDQLADAGQVPKAEEREVTVLFADLRGFTNICEPLTPEETIDLLNRYYTVVSDAVTRNRGHVSKFIGDGVLALFGALEQNPWRVNDAVHAALDIVAHVDALNLPQLEKSGSTLKAVVGIHTGPAVAGVAGSGDHLEFTVLGNTVNTAARVETLTRELEADILVTEAVRAELDPAFRVTAMPAQTVKGLSEPLVTFAVQGYGD